MMDSQIRVRTDKKYRDLYNQLKNVAIGDSHELFFLCTCLAYRRGKKRKPLGRSGDDRFWSTTIKPEEWVCYYAMILEENEMDFASIKDDKKVLARIEEYANAGMQILLDECLGDFVTGAGGNPVLESKSPKDLSKVLLHHIFSEAMQKN